jgi:Leucine-rich repeat (LRR) protein
MEKWKVPKIDIISIANNSIVSEMPILFMPKLRELNIDNNNIT